MVVPSFELTRRLGTLISQTIYQLVYERAYTKEGLVRAANEVCSSQERLPLQLTVSICTILSKLHQAFIYQRVSVFLFLTVTKGFQGVSVLGECIANEEWDRMSYVASTDLVEQTKIARRRFVYESTHSDVVNEQ